MAAIAPGRPAPNTTRVSSPDPTAFVEPAALGEEGRILQLTRRKTMQQWFNRSLYLLQLLEELSDDELPAVLNFPIVRTVRTCFRPAGEYEPLPFPDSDD